MLTNLKPIEVRTIKLGEKATGNRQQGNVLTYPGSAIHLNWEWVVSKMLNVVSKMLNVVSKMLTLRQGFRDY